jgi:hypothetical protein
VAVSVPSMSIDFKEFTLFWPYFKCRILHFSDGLEIGTGPSLTQPPQKTDTEGTGSKLGQRSASETRSQLFPEGLYWSHENGFLNRKNKWMMETFLQFFEYVRSQEDVHNFAVRFGVPLDRIGG